MFVVYFNNNLTPVYSPCYCAFLLNLFRVKTVALARSYPVTILLGTFLVGPPKLPGTLYTQGQSPLF
jgi:hypothetical protein